MGYKEFSGQIYKAHELMTVSIILIVQIENIAYNADYRLEPFRNAVANIGILQHMYEMIPINNMNMASV